MWKHGNQSLCCCEEWTTEGIQIILRSWNQNLSFWLHEVLICLWLLIITCPKTAWVSAQLHKTFLHNRFLCKFLRWKLRKVELGYKQTTLWNLSKQIWPFESQHVLNFVKMVSYIVITIKSLWDFLLTFLKTSIKTARTLVAAITSPFYILLNTPLCVYNTSGKPFTHE